MNITLGHSPDSDDAFMFYALQKQVVQNTNYQFEHIVRDIETLNELAFHGGIDVTALSLHVYAHLDEKYELLRCGASVGDGYGPIIVTREISNGVRLRGKRIAVPGKWTTAFLILKLYEPEFEYIHVPFDQILSFVESGQADFGLVIHEGQITYSTYKLSKVVDLGHWWKSREKLPLPLGVNAIRKSLPYQHKTEIQEIIKKSIKYGLDNRKEALNYALGYARGVKEGTADRFVSLYVNNYTLDIGSIGIEAIQRVLLRAYEANLIPRLTDVNFVKPLTGEYAFSS